VQVPLHKYAKYCLDHAFIKFRRKQAKQSADKVTQEMTCLA